MAELDPAELATVLDAANRLLSDADWDGAYNLLYPLSEANAAAGSDLGRLDFYLGEACLGLHAYDAAMTYYRSALAIQSGDAAAVTRGRIESLHTCDTAADCGDMTELDEINQSALHASWDGDYVNAQRLFEQMLASNELPVTDRGRLHRNVGVMQIYLHDYEGARASFEEAARVGTPDIQSLARASLAQLDANASAVDIVAGIDLSAN
jgi:tetratricopeptide (TPR) repeat protein